MKQYRFIIAIIIICSMCGCSNNSRSMITQYNLSYPNVSTTNEIIKNKTLVSKSRKICVIPKNFKNTMNLDLNTSAGLLINIDKQKPLYVNNAEKKLYPASLTKVLTALIVLEQCNLEEVVTIQESALMLEENAKTSGIKPGDKLKLKQLLYGLIVNSGNDCANAIAEHVSGSVNEFAKLMNKRSAMLGAKNSNFVNPHGLFNKEHITTLYDLYLIFNQAYKFPLFKEIIHTKNYHAQYKNNNNLECEITWVNTNQFLNSIYTPDKGIEVWGGKTGFVTDSGYNLMTIAYYNDTPYFAAIIGAKTKEQLYLEMIKLLNLVKNNS